MIYYGLDSLVLYHPVYLLMLPLSYAPSVCQWQSLNLTLDFGWLVLLLLKLRFFSDFEFGFLVQEKGLCSRLKFKQFAVCKDSDLHWIRGKAFSLNWLRQLDCKAVTVASEWAVQSVVYNENGDCDAALKGHSPEIPGLEKTHVVSDWEMKASMYDLQNVVNLL